MSKKHFSMSADRIAEVMGTVGSPLIVIAELIKNSVDASAKEILVTYNLEEKSIVIENDYKGFSIEEIESLFMPGISYKKTGDSFKNEHGMFFTGSKGLGLLSVFLLCENAEIFTAPSDKIVHKIVLNKRDGTVNEHPIKQKFERHFTKIILKNVDPEIINHLSSETEVKKLRHICTHLYKSEEVPFPKITLHISGQDPQVVNFSCNFPPMLYDVYFNFQKETSMLHFRCNSPCKQINNAEVKFSDFSLKGLQNLMLKQYGIKDTIPTRINDRAFSSFDEVPTFEGRIIVYDKTKAGSQLKTYGAGVNIYVNEFALYNYLAEENDWLGLADYSQRKKSTNLKPHNVFGYVNFPSFNENEEVLRISNERADFIQDVTFVKLMYLLKGVVMFAILNIDVADKNPKYKVNSNNEYSNSNQNNHTTSEGNNSTSSSGNEKVKDSEAVSEQKNSEIETGAYSPENSYKPKRNVCNHLEFTRSEGQIIEKLKKADNLSHKIYSLVFELSKLDLQVHRYSIACLYRSLLESSTRYFIKKHPTVEFRENQLEGAITNVLAYISNYSSKGDSPSPKTIDAWRITINKRKLIDTLNEYIHNELPVDAHLLQETWNTMKGYVIACLTK